MNPRSAINYLLRQTIYRYGRRSFVGADCNRSESENGHYVRFVERAVRSYKVFSRFKAHPHYRAVLEHVSFQDGLRYLQFIAKTTPDLTASIDRFKINDIIGSPIRCHYDSIGMISPTTLRYLKVAADLRTMFGDLSGKKIVEIGVGYGGQLLVLDQMYENLQYHLFDLPPVLDLTSKYLECHILNSAYKLETLNQNCGNEKYDLAISNYAFAELPGPLQRKYVEKILSRSQRGYMTMDSGKANSCFKQNHLSLQELQTLLPNCEIFEEEPKTWEDNYILVWGRCK